MASFTFADFGATSFPKAEEFAVKAPRHSRGETNDGASGTNNFDRVLSTSLSRETIGDDQLWRDFADDVDQLLERRRFAAKTGNIVRRRAPDAGVRVPIGLNSISSLRITGHAG